MYICKQVNPEWQEDNLFYTYKDKNGKYHLGWNDDVYENNVIIYGNKDYHNSTIKEFDAIMQLDSTWYEYEPLTYKSSNHCYWNNVSEFVNWYFAKSNGKKYTTKEIHKWKMLFDKYQNRWNIDDIVEEALELMTGKKWRAIKLVGNCQSDWQYGYASEEITDNDVRYIEMCYFNTGVEYLFYENEEDYENDNPSTSYYVDSWQSKQRLCEHIGCEPNELKVYNFTGYKKIAQYEEE